MAVRDRTDDTRSHHTHRRRKKKIHNWRIRISSGYETGSTVARVCSVCELRISQPAISKHIAELEHALGLELVERARRDGALTSAGDFVANHVLRAESLLVRAGLGVAQFRKSGSGSVAVVASSLTGSYRLPEIIAEFQHSNPGVRVTLQVGTAEQAIELLRSHRAELGFVAGTVAAPEIETEPLFEYDVVIVGKSALVPRRPSRDSLEKLTWISREDGSATRISSDAGLARLGIVPRRRLELPSNEAVVYALKKGYGIAAIGRYVVVAGLRTDHWPLSAFVGGMFATSSQCFVFETPS